MQRVFRVYMSVKEWQSVVGLRFRLSRALARLCAAVSPTAALDFFPVPLFRRCVTFHAFPPFSIATMHHWNVISTYISANIRYEVATSKVLYFKPDNER